MRAVAAEPYADVAELRAALVAAAGELHREEVERCVRIGDHGAELLRAGAQVLTHCNAGALATGGYGTALGVVRSAHRRDPHLHVWVDETRPLFQGARLTAWELRAGGHRRHPDHRLDGRLADGAGQGRRGVTGADRIARNGDTANKIGTYGLSVLARAHGVPFYVAAPTSTIDPSTPTGAEIPIEHRAPAEVLGSHSRGRCRGVQPRVRRDPGREHQRDRDRGRRAATAVSACRVICGTSWAGSIPS